MITIRVEGAAELDRYFRNVDGEIERASRASVNRVLRQAESYAQSIAPRGATLEYVRGISAERVRLTKNPSTVRGRLVARAPHSPYVEYGTRPHWPPREPILRWVLAKGLASGRDAHRVAFLVCRAIARRGTRAQNIMERSFAKYRDTLFTMIGDGVWKAAISSRVGVRGRVVRQGPMSTPLSWWKSPFD